MSHACGIPESRSAQHHRQHASPIGGHHGPLAQALADAGPEPEVVLESTYGWYWATDDGVLPGAWNVTWR